MPCSPSSPLYPDAGGSNQVPVPVHLSESAAQRKLTERGEPDLDWKLALVTFSLVFFAELGDKTQLMVMSMSARSNSPQMIFLGAAAALVASTLLATLVGDALLRVVPLRMVKLLTGAAFLMIGAVLILKTFR